MHDARIRRLQARLDAEGLDALLISALPNVFYLSAFTGSAASLLITPAERWLITDFRYHGRMDTEVQGGWQLADNSSKDLGRDVLPALPNAAALRRIGFEAAHVSVAQHGRLSSLGGREFVPTLDWVEDLRRVKDRAEIETIRRAVRLGEQVFGELLPLITPRTSEADLAAEIEYRTRKHGAKECSFKPIIASGERSALPHAGFSSRLIEFGAPLTIDMGAVLDGYCSDMTRTIFPGECPARWRELYAIVLEAKRRGFAASRPGASGREADSAAREYIAAQGFGAQFGHGLGHGVGIQIHEAPRLASTDSRLLEAGNVVSCEPGIYLPGEGGIRIEDMTLINASGPENLNTLSDELLVV